jgi:membrane associated rhomboid family serine protease
MFFPLGDDNSGVRLTPWLVYALIGACVATWIRQLMAGDAFTYGFAAIPFEVMRGVDLIQPVTVLSGGRPFELPHAPGPSPIQLTVITSMFLHGSWAHLLGNMLYLWIFGDQIEDLLGRLRFLFFYLTCGAIAALAQILTDSSAMVPTVGASGAIAGVLGAYLAKFPRNSVRVLLFFQVVPLPAILVLGLWFVMQFVSQAGQPAGVQGGVAYMAHIAGFVAGFIFILFMKPRRPVGPLASRWP